MAEPDAAALIEAALPELKTWVGRAEVIEDDISLTAARRAAAMLNRDPAGLSRGSELPRHWFSLFFASNALQRDIGPDGHPEKGLFLPPIPLPRRMAAGRRVTMSGSLRVGEPATRTAEVVAITPKLARTGHLIVLTMRQSYATSGRTVAVEEFDAVYREGLAPGEKNPEPPHVTPPADAAWSDTVTLSNPLVFRYSALTWNAHRIHYDADYTRGVEGYPELVQNGGLTMQLMLEAAAHRLPGPLTGFEARLMRPLWVGDTLRIEGASPTNDGMKLWAVDKSGAQAVAMDVTHEA